MKLFIVWLLATLGLAWGVQWNADQQAAANNIRYCEPANQIEAPPAPQGDAQWVPSTTGKAYKI